MAGQLKAAAVPGDGFRYRCWCRSACYSKGKLAALLSDPALTVVACDASGADPCRSR